MAWTTEFLLLVVMAAGTIFLGRHLSYLLHARNTTARLLRYSPPVAQELSPRTDPTRSEVNLLTLLMRLDPTFASTERQLRSLGIEGSEVILWTELLKLALATVACLGAAAVLASYHPNLLVQWLSAGGLFVVVLFGANALLKSMSKSRRRRIMSELGFGIDLLTIFLESGQSLDQALRSFREVSSRATPLLEGAQRRLISDLDNGIPYEKALDAWARNLAVGHAESLASLFVQSLVHGSELAPQLRRFSVDLAERRVMAARESIGSKSARLTIVMVVFFLPAILAFIAAPPFVSVIEHLGAMN